MTLIRLNYWITMKFYWMIELIWWILTCLRTILTTFNIIWLNFENLNKIRRILKFSCLIKLNFQMLRARNRIPVRKLSDLAQFDRQRVFHPPPDRWPSIAEAFRHIFSAKSTFQFSVGRNQKLPTITHTHTQTHTLAHPFRRIPSAAGHSRIFIFIFFLFSLLSG